MELPKDAVILLSFVNTKLRDFYPSLDEFCKAAGVERGYIVDKNGKVRAEKEGIARWNSDTVHQLIEQLLQ